MTLTTMTLLRRLFVSSNLISLYVRPLEQGIATWLVAKNSNCNAN